MAKEKCLFGHFCRLQILEDWSSDVLCSSIMLTWKWHHTTVEPSLSHYKPKSFQPLLKLVKEKKEKRKRRSWGEVEVEHMCYCWRVKWGRRILERSLFKWMAVEWEGRLKCRRKSSFPEDEEGWSMCAVRTRTCVSWLLETDTTLTKMAPLRSDWTTCLVIIVFIMKSVKMAGSWLQWWASRESSPESAL